jgi:oxygen-dependent protoporphyrinogen oxidase
MTAIPSRIIVIGGGVTGLAAAWRLKQAFAQSPESLHLLLLEPSAHIGGAIQTVERDGFLLEIGPDCFISENPAGVELCRELGLAEELIGTQPAYRRSFILRNNRLHPIPEGFYLMGPARVRPFLETKLLSWKGKSRALLEPLIPARERSDESLGSFVRRRLGQEMLDWLAQPLISGIYGADPNALSLRATFPQFQEMEAKYGSILLGLKKRASSNSPTMGEEISHASGARFSLFVTLRRGLEMFTRELEKRLGASVIQRQTSVKAIVREGESWQVVKANGERLLADAVVVALPSYDAAPLVKTLDPELAEELTTLTLYGPAATINYAFREMDVTHPFDGVGFVVPTKEGKMLCGCTFGHRKFEGRAPKGFVLLRAFLGGDSGAPWLQEKDERLTQRVLEELHQILGFHAKPLFTIFERYEQALPQYTIGHLNRVVAIEEQLLRWKGLALAGNWQYGVGIPDCIESAGRAAQSLISYLEHRALVVS